MLDDLVALLPTSKATWVLVVTGVTTLAFALGAISALAPNLPKTLNVGDA